MNSLTCARRVAVPLCDSQGQLNPDAVGWSSRPRTHCHIPHHFGRRKRWNHWCITTPDWILSLTLVDFDYLGHGAIHFLDLHSGKSVSHSRLRFLARQCQLPDMPYEDHFFLHPQLQLTGHRQGNAINLNAHALSAGHAPLHANFEVQWPEHLDSVNVVCPMGKRTFNASCRQLSLPISGAIKIGKHEYRCSAGRSFASLDFARGVWPLHSHWQRAAFAAPGGIAGNFGTGWGNELGQSENALLFAGELFSLPHAFSITHTQEPIQKWQLNSPCGRVDLSFKPLQMHRMKNRVGPLFADTRQYFGQYDGMLIGPNAEQVPLNNVIGWLGQTHARW